MVVDIVAMGLSPYVDLVRPNGGPEHFFEERTSVATNERTLELLRHLANRPGHDEVKADFRQILIEEFDVVLGALISRGVCPRSKGDSMR